MQQQDNSNLHSGATKPAFLTQCGVDAHLKKWGTAAESEGPLVDKGDGVATLVTSSTIIQSRQEKELKGNSQSTCEPPF